MPGRKNRSKCVFGRGLQICAVALALLAPDGREATAEGFFVDTGPAKSEARLVSGWAASDGTRIAALRVDLAEGWKTYWRNPGEAGIPPTFDWSGSENLAAVKIAWPAPIVFDSYGVRTIGYEHEMMLPLQVTPDDPTRPVRLSLALFYGVCDDICIPARADIALNIEPGAPAEGEAEIRAALEATPAPASGAGLKAAHCAIEGVGEAQRLTARLAFAAAPVHAPLVVAEGPEGVWFGPLETRLEKGEIVATGEMRAAPGEWIDRSALRLTLLDRAEGPALTVAGCPAS
ncbi:hypothetical protein G5B40_18265 [Pikeienuella piscinae]|uniref:Thiol:disulfide interchange protein DsbD N-terminal domain-containing protein n=1 Tax=Pikeienuella piscinae TaxID=2748098 RepID=A0A7M3T5D3_9RHOB|nr:protein-disulfide reductase DsbD domain-containing protein [Pikeienuella piscinae]QIE57214.1 hypothetical protein G5B40_18265 [Pikeienuella piscinae]